MNAQKKIDPDAKLISYTLNSFSSEAEMDLFVNFFEKNGKEFFENLKTQVCLMSTVMVQLQLMNWRP